jgi:DNA-binding NarL/FixJ family response regulator
MTITAGARIRVLVVDDEPMVCAHLDTILSVAGDIEVTDPAHDGAAAVEAVIRHRPDLVLMDLRMPGVGGLAAIERISRLAAAPAVVALTTFDADHLVVQALRSGATGYLLKSTPPEDFIALVRVAAAGHTVLSPAAASRLVADAAREHAALDQLRKQADRLTDRERDVLRCVGDGMSNAQIGHVLHLTEATVKGYLSRVFDKLNCTNRAQVAVIASRLALRPPQADPDALAGYPVGGQHGGQ